MTAPGPTPRLAMRVRRVPGMPLVAVRLWLRGGTCREEIPGQAYVTGQLLTEGTERRSWERVHLEAENRGMALQSFGTHEMHGLALDALAADWQLALEWAAEVLFEPAFPEERFEWVRRRTAAELESLLDRPEIRTAKAFLEQLYEPHPYGRSLRGDPQSLARLSREDCRAFHRRALGEGVVAVVTGDVDEAQVEARLAELLGRLEGEAEPAPEPPPPRGGAPRQEIQASRAEQAHLFVGHLTLPRHHPDLPALDLAGTVLGAGPGLAGRLPERIREKEGLAYGVDVQTSAGSGFERGRFGVYAGTSPKTVEAAERAVAEELERFLEDGMSEEEFADARSFLVGAEPFRRETARQWADVLAEAAFYGLPTDDPRWVLERLECLTRERVEAVAREHLRPRELKVTVGLPVKG